MKLALPFAALACAGCSDTCQNQVASRVLSPDGSHVAVLFRRDCGATTAFSTQISILDAAGKLSGPGNAFVADDNRGANRADDWQGPWAEIKWLTPNRLLVRYAAKSRLFKLNDHVSGVSITYQAIRS